MALVDTNQVLEFIANAYTRSMNTMFGGAYALDTKHSNYYDSYGYPKELTFDQFYTRFKRDPLAKAVCERAIKKCWQDYPSLREDDDPDNETQQETLIRQRFEELRVWPKLAEVDLRSRVGEYAAVILRLADGKQMDQPVETVPGGLDGLVEIIPAWQGQLRASDWNSDVMSLDYGKPTMYQFNESSVNPEEGKIRSFNVHPDRVIIWSRDGTVYGTSVLEGVYNALLDAEKVRGAGGEGFWQAAKGTPHFDVDKDANIQQLAQMLGAADASEIQEKMGEISDGARKGFDKALVTQGIKSTNQTYAVPNSREPFEIAVQSVASGAGIPMKILLGSQSGERASTEDANEWNQTCQSRRNNYVKPNIMSFVERLERFSIIPKSDWTLNWTDLTESSMKERLELMNIAADANSKMRGTGEAPPLSSRQLTVDIGGFQVDEE